MLITISISLDPVWPTRPAVLLWDSPGPRLGTYAQWSCSGAQPGPRLAYMPSCPALGLSLDPVWAHTPSQWSCSGAQPRPHLAHIPSSPALGLPLNLSGTHTQQSCSGAPPGPHLAHTPSSPALGLPLNLSGTHTQQSCSGAQPGPRLAHISRDPALGLSWTPSGTQVQRSCSWRLILASRLSHLWSHAHIHLSLKYGRFLALWTNKGKEHGPLGSPFVPLWCPQSLGLSVNFSPCSQMFSSYKEGRPEFTLPGSNLNSTDTF